MVPCIMIDSVSDNCVVISTTWFYLNNCSFLKNRNCYTLFSFTGKTIACCIYFFLLQYLTVLSVVAIGYAFKFCYIKQLIIINNWKYFERIKQMNNYINTLLSTSFHIIHIQQFLNTINVHMNFLYIKHCQDVAWT